MKSDQDYVAQLGEVLRRRDPQALRAFLEESAARFGDERQVADIRRRSPGEMAELMHRMILARADLSHLHQDSRRWLNARQSRPLRRPAGRGRGDHRVN